jgi:hypothetical protein
MRNVTLNELTEQVRAEARLSTNTSRGLDDLSNIQQKIRRVQEELYDEFDWPFMRIDKTEATKTLAAGQRYYDFPTNMNIERAFELWTNTTSVWGKMDQGISLADYSAQDSDEDERSDPALKWDIISETQFEVWPIPASNGGLVRFDGIKKLTPMVDTNDRADLDDRMIVLFVAAEILAANKQPDAQLILEKAQKRQLKMQGRLASKKRLFMGGAQEEPRTGLRIRVPRVTL